MLTNENLVSIMEVIDYINKQNNISLYDLSSKVEDPDYFYKIIKKINKTKINKIFDNSNKEELKKIEEHLDFTKEGIQEIFQNEAVEEISQKYNLEELKNMYYSIYLKVPPSKYKKNDIIDALNKRYKNLERLDGFVDLKKISK